MWFRLCLGVSEYGIDSDGDEQVENLYHSLAALVGSDGKLYWRCQDVAMLADKCETFAFNPRYNLRGRDVLKPKDTISGHTMRCHVMSTKQVYDWLHVHELGLAILFHKALTNGQCSITHKKGLYHSWYLKAPCLLLEEEGDTNISTWIQEFIANVQEMRATTSEGLLEI